VEVRKDVQIDLVLFVSAPSPPPGAAWMPTDPLTGTSLVVTITSGHLVVSRCRWIKVYFFITVLQADHNLLKASQEALMDGRTGDLTLRMTTAGPKTYSGS
jgi:hypothetical protein